jgi:hypothetical protein
LKRTVTSEASGLHEPQNLERERETKNTFFPYDIQKNKGANSKEKQQD